MKQFAAMPLYDKQEECKSTAKHQERLSMKSYNPYNRSQDNARATFAFRRNQAFALPGTVLSFVVFEVYVRLLVIIQVIR